MIINLNREGVFDLRIEVSSRVKQGETSVDIGNFGTKKIASDFFHFKKKTARKCFITIREVYKRKRFC